MCLRFPILLSLLFLALTGQIPAAVHNLETMKQDFVLETKNIIIPDCEAFNPSIVRWNGRLLMSYRIRHQTTKTTDQIGLVWLTENFDLDSPPMILERHEENITNPSFAQDPRLIVIDNQLYAVYSNTYPLCGKNVRRVVVGRIEYDGTHFAINNPDSILNFPGEDSCRKEKNWAPFAYENQLFLAYSIQPHLIFSHLYGSDICETVACTKSKFKWEWGKLCGGTPAEVVNNNYLAFFHSVKSLVSVQSEGKMMTHYFIGAYLFDIAPPFAINAISPKPIVAHNFYRGKMYDTSTWKPLRVVYPGGFVYDEQFIWLIYGRQDHEIWVVKLDKEKLFKSLKSVEKID